MEFYGLLYVSSISCTIDQRLNNPSDNVNQRTLSATQPASNVMTIEMCQASCSAGGYKYAGVESVILFCSRRFMLMVNRWSVECYCANTITLGAGPATDGRCDMACAGMSVLPHNNQF